MKYIFITDFPCDQTLYHAAAFDKAKCKFIGMPVNEKNLINKYRKILFYLGYFRIALKALLMSKKDDILISWNFNIGVCVAIWSKILLKKRDIVSLNMINHTTGGLLLKFKRIVYNYVLSDANFHLSVNGLETLDEYAKYFKISSDRVFNLQDAYEETYCSQPYSKGKGYVFCGGMVRDWQVYFKAATLLPNISFVGVAREKALTANLLKNKPDNVTMYYDISLIDFYHLLSDCSVVVIPLPTKATGGLIVIFQSVFMNKPIVATNTPAIKGILYNEETGLWGGEVYELGESQDLVNKINKVLSDESYARMLCSIMQENIRKFSPMNFSRTILSYVKNIRY